MNLQTAYLEKEEKKDCKQIDNTEWQLKPHP